mmetsp:Transcript_46317/g.148758  ORF Transcript_46317/g.148758 Transcript_46317/m.148758 type:complete len:375 (+) Transcript_46317:80-1204(+)
MDAHTVGVDVEEVELVLRVQNFELTYRQFSPPYDPDAEAFEVNVVKSDVITKVGDHSFRLAICWSLDSNLDVTEHSVLGAVVERLRGAGDPAASVQFRLENKDDMHSVTVPNHDPEAQKYSWTLGYYPEPYAVKREDNDGLARMLDVLDKSKGFLQDGAIVVRCKMKVALPTRRPSTMPSLQLEGPMKLGKQLGGLLDTGRHADVQIIIGAERIAAHSLILSARSPVFEAMWAHAMRENSEMSVTIDDLEPTAVRAMVKFMYTGTLDNELANDSITVALMKAAHKYEVADLFDHCNAVLSSDLTEECALNHLMLADMFGSERLRGTCLEFVTRSSQRIARVQQSLTFQELVKTRPHLLAEILVAGFPPAKRHCS